MDEELTNLVETELYTEDIEQNIESEETTEVVEVEAVEEVEIEVDEGVGWVGGDSTRHYSLYGRDEPDQHPITSIIGLRDELNDIEALDVVYSNERNQANYYLWEDENILQEDRVGYFVSACSDINEIKICTSDNNIFGVTVGGAGFIGGQDDVSRDIKYGLVVTTGIVHVRCESNVAVGDYVISNDYGCAKKNKTGYKVVGIHDIDGIKHAEIILVTPINKICELANEVEDLDERMGNAENNISAAMKTANDAYHKAGEAGEISEEAVKNALEALNKSKDTANKTNGLELMVESAKKNAEEAKAISNSAEVAAERIRTEAVATSNDALVKVNKTQGDLNGLIDEMTPLSQWEGENGIGIAGFVARANADSATLATLAEWKEDGSDNQSIAGTVAKVNEHEAILNYITSNQGTNGSTIAQVEQKADDNGASITSLVTSVDKYSVGEFSQAYGLTRKQASNILKPGYIYIPTQHKGDIASHCEIFVGESEENWFTPGDYYVWGVEQGNADWIERSTGSVWISDAIPANSDGKFKYWYISSNNPPEGYEAYALYVWETPEDGEPYWEKVNVLAGNSSNRAVGMIRQTTNEIDAKVNGARGDISALKLNVDSQESRFSLLCAKVDPSSLLYQIVSTIYSSTDALPSAGTKNYYYVVGTAFPYNVYYWDGSEYKQDTNLTYDGAYLYKVNTASIIGAVNDSGSSVAINADHIVLNGYNISNANGSFQIDDDGRMIATGGKIGGWDIGQNVIQKYADNYRSGMASATSSGAAVFYAGVPNESGSVVENANFYVTLGGKLYAKNAEIEGKITAGTGTIGGWVLGTKKGAKTLYSSPTSTVYGTGMSTSPTNTDPAFWAGYKGTSSGDTPWDYGADSGGWRDYTYFYVTQGGELHSKAGQIGGWTINGDILDSSHNGYRIYLASATNIARGTKNWIRCYNTKTGDTYFSVSSTGRLYATDVTMSGNIGAIQGSFGIWNIGVYNDQECIYAEEGSNTKVAFTKDRLHYAVLAESYSAYWDDIIMGATNYDHNGVSDKNVKNSISNLDDSYDNFFNELKPCKYKYNSGTSERYHTGFIAQEVVEALENNQLDTTDFAAVMKLKTPTHDGAEWMLRRDEFVALNTWQIQKAKARITELENKVAELEKLIKEK